MVDPFLPGRLRLTRRAGALPCGVDDGGRSRPRSCRLRPPYDQLSRWSHGRSAPSSRSIQAGFARVLRNRLAKSDPAPPSRSRRGPLADFEAGPLRRSAGTSGWDDAGRAARGPTRPHPDAVPFVSRCPHPRICARSCPGSRCPTESRSRFSDQAEGVVLDSRISPGIAVVTGPLMRQIPSVTVTTLPGGVRTSVSTPSCCDSAS